MSKNKIKPIRQKIDAIDHQILKLIQKRGSLAQKIGKLKSLIGQNRLIIDGGHNINSAISISNWVKQQNEKVHLICGMMNDKPHKEFVNQFESFVNSITLVDIPNQEGSISKEEFKKKLEAAGAKVELK